MKEYPYKYIGKDPVAGKKRRGELCRQITRGLPSKYGAVLAVRFQDGTEATVPRNCVRRLKEAGR